MGDFMAHVKPFRGLRPVPEKVGDVASPPYDVLNSEEAREKAKDNPLSFLHIVKPEIDLDPSVDLYDPKVYAKGAENLKRLIDDKVMVQDEKPCYYIYKLRMGDHEQIGLVAVASVADYIQNKIKKHEHTRPDKEQDRVNHVNHLNAQTGPVFLTYRASQEIDKLIQEGMKNEPVYDFVGDYEVQHTFYVVDESSLIDKISKAFAAIDALYVADGHHRSAAATRVRNMRMEANPGHTGEEAYNYFLTVIFPDSQMRILDYNRVATDLNGLSEDEFLSKVDEKFDITIQGMSCGACGGCGQEPHRPQAMHEFGLYLDGQWYALKAKESTFDASDPIAQLDVSILQENLLTPILGVQDPRTDKRVAFVGGIRGLTELEKLVDNGTYAVAFALYPTSIHQLLSVADAGKVMPPKSTWFEPKLRSGVVVHLLD
jgi:uncharacterized protein (DUF1015 family)